MLLGEKAKAPCLSCLNTRLASAPTKGHQQSLYLAIDSFASWAALSEALFTASLLNIRSTGLQRPPDFLLCFCALFLPLASTSPYVSHRPVPGILASALSAHLLRQGRCPGWSTGFLFRNPGTGLLRASQV